jgi:alkylation response protein AidB-like acyl-CoA dehydrogenase
MTAESLAVRLRQVVQDNLPVPGAGNTPERHQALYAVAREDVSLAKLAEAHWDALAILSEAGRAPIEGAIYAVWASEVPGDPVRLEESSDGLILNGKKPFCSGIGLVDRALLTTDGLKPRLVDVDLRSHADHMTSDLEAWKTLAFAATNTGSLAFHAVPVEADAQVGEPGWYLERPGFWHGACGPAACWAGGVAGLLDVALASKRRDPHTTAHLGALYAGAWAMESLLQRAGIEIDQEPGDKHAAYQRALSLRHCIEQLATDCLRRFARAYGPYPLSMAAAVARRYGETDLYLRQCHAERDLESLGSSLGHTSA